MSGDNYPVTIVVESPFPIKIKPSDLKENLNKEYPLFPVLSIVSKQVTGLWCSEVENKQCVYVTVNVFNVGTSDDKKNADDYVSEVQTKATGLIQDQGDENEYEVWMNPVYSAFCPSIVCPAAKKKASHIRKIFGVAVDVLPHMIYYLLVPSTT